MKKSGFAAATGAYILWGLFPIYWKWLQHVSPLQVIAHRIVWSFLILLIIIFATRQIKTFFQAKLKSPTFWVYMLAASLIGSNWLVYVWAVNAEFIVEASLGYFINPLFSVLLGVIFLRERLRFFQWPPLILAALGVVYLSVVYGHLPWIALTLALTFSIYGLLKKLSPFGSIPGLTIETGILFVPAIFYLVYADISGSGAFFSSNLTTNLLLIGSGLITTVTLLMFTSAAQKLPLFTVGILEYIAPTLAFLLGVFIFQEPFNQNQLVGFMIIWIALIFFVLEEFLTQRKTFI